MTLTNPTKSFVTNIYETDLTPIETRLTAVEAENADQESAIGGLDSRIDTLEAKPPATFTRTSISATTSAIASQVSTALSLPLGRAFLLLSASSDFPARIRIYTNEAYRFADLNRATGTEPIGEHGLILEIITTASNLNLDLSPMAWGSSADGLPVATITNLDIVSRAITVSFSTIKLEV